MTTPIHPNPDQHPAHARDQQDRSTETKLQGEGDYEAARRHRASAEHFIAQGKVAPAAEAAAPDSAAEARALKAAEQAGRQHAKR